MFLFVFVRFVLIRGSGEASSRIAEKEFSVGFQ